MVYFLQCYCTMLPSQALVYQHLGRPTTWPVLLRLMYHRLFSGCTAVMVLKWPMGVASPSGLREPLSQPPPSPSPSTLCTHHMEDSTPAGQQLTYLHQQWVPQEMWLSKVSVNMYTTSCTCSGSILLLYLNRLIVKFIFQHTHYIWTECKSSQQINTLLA